MAERRMFAKTIVTSDAFLEMPASTRCLYFQLAMQADDDGFINRPKAIMRESGACDDDLKLLIAKRFLIPFESGVVVIKHWKIHNLIQSDRYKETKYLDERSELFLDDTGAYTLSGGTPLGKKPVRKPLTGAQRRRLEAKKESTLPYCFESKIRQAFVGKVCPICGCTMNYSNNLVKPTIQHNIPISLGGKHEIDNISVICSSCNTSIQNHTVTPAYNTEEVREIWECIGNGPGMDTQVRLGKVSIGKSSIGKVSIGESEGNVPAHAESYDYDSFKETYNTSCSNLPPCKILTDKRTKAIRDFTKDFTLDQWKEICEKANASDFLTGKNDRGWKAGIDFLLRKDKAARVLEGGYNNKQEQNSNPFLEMMRREEAKLQNGQNRNAEDYVDIESVLP